MDGGGRPRNGVPMGGNRRPSGESRRPPGAPGGPPSTASSATGASGMSRAERFDDERRRITESCFAKVDEQGQLVESYITHIRVQEDAGYPQSPPPPGGNPASKKARVIIVSVRATGRVRLHKARENANGTFSIGKTWNMEELSGVENFVHGTPATEEQAQHKRWAGDIGFLVTISKPYYWEAGTAKEKEFFIGSMVKIYHKYTQGDFPVLSGFSLAELNGLTGGRPHLATPEARAARKNGATPPPSRPSQPPSSMQPSPRSPLPPGAQQGTPPPGERDRRPPPLRDERRPTTSSEERRPPPRSRPPTADDDRRGPPPRRPPTAEGDQRDRRPPPVRGIPPGRPSTGDEGRRPPPLRDNSSGTGTPTIPALAVAGDGQRPRPRPSMEQGLRPSPSREQMAMRSPPSRDQMRPKPPAVSPTPPAHLTPQSSRSEFNRPTTPDSMASSIPTNASPNRRAPADDARSQRSRKSFDEDGPGLREPRRLNGQPSPSRRDPSPNRLRPGTAQSNASSAFSRNDDAPALESPMPRNGVPERKRPPMASTTSQQSQRSLASEPPTTFHTPSQSPAPPSSLQAGRRPPDLERPSTRGNEFVPEPLQPKSPAFAPAQPPPASPLPQIPRAPVEPKAPATRPLTPKAEIAPPVQEATAPAPAPAEAAPTPESPEKTTSPIEEQTQHRPGLGPMVKKNKMDAANVLRKAAFAAGAFKPRAGGAAERLLTSKEKKSDEPDGISGVFVPQRQNTRDDVEKKAEERADKTDIADKRVSDQATPDRPAVATEAVPSVKVSSPIDATPVAATPPAIEETLGRSPSPENKAAKGEAEGEVRRKKRRSNHQIMNISKLGIDPSILDDRGLEFEILLSEFGWGSSDLSVKNIETLEHDIKHEIARVEAGSWLNHLEQKDDRVEAVEKMLDRAIAECDELEGLLTLYNVELSSLNDDVAFIEAQSQGLQVQTANQRILQTELQQLVDTISITADQLEPLRRERIGKVDGLRTIESALVLLYKALITIDPAFVEGSARRASNAGELTKVTSAHTAFGNSELASMQALQEKKERYIRESALFLERLKQHLTMTFGAAFLQTKDALGKISKTSMPSTKANIEAHDAGRDMLWMLGPVVLFAKEVDRASWDELLRLYQSQASQVYQEEVRDNILAWKRFARKPSGEEQELLFNAPEKETESITGAARKLTVKRSQTLARGLRSASGDKEAKAEKTQTGKLFAFDVFRKVLDDIDPVLLTEQNFITEFFHATSTDAVDFPDAVEADPPERRRGPSLWVRKQFEADRDMAKRVAQVMEDIFSFWPTEIQNLVEWAVTMDPLQGVGILCAVDRKLLEIEDSNQDFLTRTLQKVHERLTALFTRFVDEQIRAIEDTKVKIKKRKGVIRFINTFPHFSVAIENMLPPPDEGDQLEIRRMIDDAYQKINKAMFESLKVIAKESPAVMGTQGQGDPEDKEALNYHILLIENMNHYMEEVDARSDPVLSEWMVKAQDDYHEHMDLYVDAVIRRPLGKLLEFIESTETLLNQPGASPQSIAQRSSHSRSVFKKLVHANDAKEIKKGIEALKKRVDKHFGDADDASISRNLVAKVFAECEKKYNDTLERTIRIGQDVYAGEVDIDWGVGEIRTAFRK